MVGRRWRAAALAATVVVAVATAGCSGDDGAATATTARPSTTASTRPVPAFSGDPGSPFCTLLRDVDATAVLAGDPDDPASVEAAFGRLIGVLRDALAAAPSDISADVALVSQGIEALDAALAAVGYDFDALAASGDADTVTDAVNDPAFTAAGNRLNAYRTQVCRL